MDYGHHSYQRNIHFYRKTRKYYILAKTYIFLAIDFKSKIKIRNSILEQEKQVTFVYDLKNNHIDCDSEFSKEYYEEIITDYLNILYKNSALQKY